MPINNYEGDTFVAFLDISGFKELIYQEKRALKALDTLYSFGYEVLKSQESLIKVEGIFISDSGILFVRKEVNQGASESLKSMLTTIKKLNEKMREEAFMLTTSIAYGKFKYQEKIEFKGIVKDQIYGGAYVSAFLDSENNKPKIQPGQCRIVVTNFPNEIVIEHNQDDILKMLKKKESDSTHYYYYWMLNNYTEIQEFEQEYKDAYNLKYAGMLKTLKKFSRISSSNLE